MVPNNVVDSDRGIGTPMCLYGTDFYLAAGVWHFSNNLLDKTLDLPLYDDDHTRISDAAAASSHRYPPFFPLLRY